MAWRSDAPEAADILDLLENIPLALILAGRWLSQKLGRRGGPPENPLAYLLQNLQTERRRLLDQHPDDKHLSLRVTFGLSYEELDEAAQRRVDALGVFGRNRFLTQGLALVWGIEDEGELAQVIQQLELVGLIQEYDDNEYWMHDVVRDYAADALTQTPDRHRAAQQSHARYVQTLLNTIELRGLDSYAFLTQFLPEVEEAAVWLTNQWQANPQLAADFAIAVDNKLYFLSELPLQAWLEVGLEAATHAEAARDEAILQSKLADLLKNRGQYDEAERLYRLSLAQFEKIGDTRGVAVTQVQMGQLLAAQQKFQEAADLYQQGLAVFQQINDLFSVGATLVQMAQLLMLVGQSADAKPLLQEAQSIFTQLQATGWLETVTQLLAQLEGQDGMAALVRLMQAAQSADPDTRANAEKAASGLLEQENEAAHQLGQAVQKLLAGASPEAALAPLPDDLREAILQEIRQ